MNGITPDMLAGSKPFLHVLEPFVALAGDAVWVAHNARFDLDFLASEFDQIGANLPVSPVLDTLALARRLWGLRSSSLPALAKHFDLDAGQAYRAMGDVLSTWQLFKRGLDDLALFKGLQTLKPLMAFVSSVRYYPLCSSPVRQPLYMPPRTHDRSE